MLEPEIRELLTIGESERVEFKLDTANPFALARIVSAFANGSGGKIFVGIDERGGIVGCDKDRLRRTFEALQRHIKGVVKMDLDFVTVDGKEVGVISVGSSGDIVMSSEGIFLRRGAATLPMSLSEIRKRFPEETASMGLIELVTEQTKRIEELYEEIARGNSWQSKIVDYLIGGIIGAVIGWVFTIVLT